MKILLYFDGTPATIDNLLVASRESIMSNSLSELYLVYFDLNGSPQPTDNLPNSLDRVKPLILQANLLLKNNNFTKINEEIVCCHFSTITLVLATLAKDNNIETIYLPYIETTSSKAAAKPSFWKTLKRKSTQTHIQSEKVPKAIAAEINPHELLQATGCKIVLTCQNEVLLRLSYTAPASKKMIGKNHFISSQELLARVAILPLPIWEQELSTVLLMDQSNSEMLPEKSVTNIRKN